MITVAKKQIDLYQVRNNAKHTWGDISIEWGEQSAKVMINSDYGHFAYNWFATGNNPKKFLCRIEMEYAMKKLCGSDVGAYEPDFDAWEEDIKRKIIEALRNGYIERGDAREAFDEMPSFVMEYRNADLIHKELIDHRLFERIFGDYENLPSEEIIKPSLVAFWKHIWKPFVEELEKEIAVAEVLG